MRPTLCLLRSAGSTATKRKEMEPSSSSTVRQEPRSRIIVLEKADAFHATVKYTAGNAIPRGNGRTNEELAKDVHDVSSFE